MKNASLITETGRKTIQIEAAALQQLTASIDDSFVACVQLIRATRGRVVVAGVGKTALVARKIVATLNSTGTPALFLHAADAIHGDIGMIQPADVVICLSNSGETEEVNVLATLVRHRGNPLIAMVSRAACTLARAANHVLLTPHRREADPNQLAPTTSTTLQMALGDALAAALCALQGFGPDDFAHFHPGGNLGKRLCLRVADIAGKNPAPAVFPTTPLHATLLEMTTHRLGATAVIDPDNKQLLGIITDGDLRRMLTATVDLNQITAADFMTPTPKSVSSDARATHALALLRKHNINQLIVLDSDGAYAGILHLHDLLREGLD